MTGAGTITKMKVTFGSPIQYELILGETIIPMNQFIGRNISLIWDNKIICTNCGKNTKTSFGQGFCFPCFQTAPEAAPCIISPELCRAHEGEGRDVEWEQTHHNQPHIVYLASSDSVKVGITRAGNQFTRWIDQGAYSTIVLAETPNRYLAGVIEVALKSELSDKTNWQRMLKNEIDESIDLVEEKWRIESILPFDLQDYFSENDEVHVMEYPVNQFPTKIKSVGFDKTPEVSGTLVGIKGQYLIFSDDRVINLRKHTGYLVRFEG